MDLEKLAAADINCEEGIGRFIGNRELYEKFVAKFPEDPTFAAMESAMESGDVQEAFRQAHTLKGVTGNLSFIGLYESVKPLVEALRSGDLELARRLNAPVQEAYRRVIAAIQA